MSKLPGTHWHLAAGGADGPRMAYGRKETLVAGKTYRIRRTPIPRVRGFHASKRVIDALHYGGGPWLSRVTLGGVVISHEGDKHVAQERTHHGFVDATMVLHEFACWCAERALKAEEKAGRKVDPRSWEALKVKRRWLRGEALDGELIAAVNAAYDAVSNTVYTVAAEAAYNAAVSAGVNVAYDVPYIPSRAAYSASYNAAYNAVSSAAFKAERAVQNRRLSVMVTTLLKEKGSK